MVDIFFPGFLESAIELELVLIFHDKGRHLEGAESGNEMQKRYILCNKNACHEFQVSALAHTHY